MQFNNHVGSTKSFDYVREHNEAVNRLDVIEARAQITADYAPGEVELVTQHDGSVLKLRKLAADYDPTDRISAMSHLQAHHARGEIVTGLLYVDPDARGPARPPGHRSKAVEPAQRRGTNPRRRRSCGHQRLIALDGGRA